MPPRSQAFLLSRWLAVSGNRPCQHIRLSIAPLITISSRRQRSSSAKAMPLLQAVRSDGTCMYGISSMF
jgi:hypothetical protein